MHVSENVREIESSATIAVATLCRALKAEGREVIDLSAGEPDFRTPDFAAQAGIAAIVQGFTHYTPVAGLPALRDMIAGHLGSVAGRAIDAAGIVVTAGAKQAIFNAFFTLFGPGDEVLLPTPYWTSYPELIKLARARPVLVPTDESSRFRVSLDDLEARLSPRTRGFILNSPANPTGAVYDASEIDAILRWAAEREIWVISDEIYGRICFSDQRASGVLDADPGLLDQVVMVDGLSKAFAMTGWRVGYSWSRTDLASRMTALQSHISSNVSTPAQFAAIAAFRPEPRVEHAVRAMVGVFRHRRERVTSLFRKHLPEARFVTPDGAFYLFFRVDAYYRDAFPDSISFCRWLLETTGVALVPGLAFGDDRFVRLSFAAPEDELAEAIRRMGEALSVSAVAQ
ncbi:MAG: pyridoxal phosphate-dependent aminotransferase [Longimicrobiales bacterium]